MPRGPERLSRLSVQLLFSARVLISDPCCPVTVTDVLWETRDQKKNSELGTLEEVLGKRWPLLGALKDE